MATISAPARSVRHEAQLDRAPVSATLDWGTNAVVVLTETLRVLLRLSCVPRWVAGQALMGAKLNAGHRT